MVGIADGLMLGLVLGFAVGDRVGPELGLEVGSALGLEVGSGVTQSPHSTGQSDLNATCKQLASIAPGFCFSTSITVLHAAAWLSS